MCINQENRQSPRAEIKWPVAVQCHAGTIKGVMKNASSTGVFICCQEPLRANEVFDMVIQVPLLDQPLKATAQVIWSSIHGQDNEPRSSGMAVRFIKISGADRKVISDAVIHHLNLEGITPDDDTIEIVLERTK